MTAVLSHSLLAEASEFVARRLGLHFPAERAGDLQRGLRSAVAGFGFSDPGEGVRWLLSARLERSQIEALAGHLTIGETYFFRGARAFKALEADVLPELIARRRGERRLRLWSAACCTGEEAYSLAIALRRALPDWREWKISLLGTDISRRFLDQAERGTFGEWSFRETPPEFRERHFRPIAAGRWQIDPEIRAMVSFAPLNLAEDAYPSLLNNTNAADLIFCRNVLIYFTPGHAARVIEKLARSLADGGWLVLGPTEVPHAARCGLTPVRFPGVIFHRKGAPAAGTGEAFAPTREPAGFVHDAHFEPVYPEPLASVEAAPVTAETPPPAPEPASPFERARLLFEQGLYAEAIAAIEEGFPHGEPEPRAAILRARALANQGRLTAALSAVERLIAGDKLNAAAHYLRAGILQEIGDAPEAAAALKRVLFLEPEFVLAHFALGNLARSQGRVAESVRHFENALALVRRHPPDRLLPESDGITAGRLALILSGLLAAKSAA